MKKLTITTFALLFGIFSYAQTLSPEVISTAGDFFEVSGVGSLSWTLGEPVVETFTGQSADVILTQGFQQPEDFGVGITEVFNTGNMSFSLYPNPAINNVRIDLTYDQSATLSLQLIDLFSCIHFDKFFFMALPL